MNRFKKRLWIAAGFAVLVTIGGVHSGPAIAQGVKAALVSSIDTPGREPYQRWLYTTACTAGASGCSVAGSAVATGKRVAITNVSGAFDVGSQADQVLTVFLEHGSVTSPGIPANVPPVYLLTSYQGTNTFLNADEFVVNAPVLAYFDANDFPIIEVVLGASNITGRPMSFAISGYVVDCSVGPCAAVVY